MKDPTFLYGLDERQLSLRLTKDSLTDSDFVAMRVWTAVSNWAHALLIVDIAIMACSLTMSVALEAANINWYVVVHLFTFVSMGSLRSEKRDPRKAANVALGIQFLILGIDTGFFIWRIVKQVPELGSTRNEAIGFTVINGFFIFVGLCIIGFVVNSVRFPLGMIEDRSVEDGYERLAHIHSYEDLIAAAVYGKLIDDIKSRKGAEEPVPSYQPYQDPPAPPSKPVSFTPDPVSARYNYNDHTDPMGLMVGTAIPIPRQPQPAPAQTGTHIHIMPGASLFGSAQAGRKNR